MGIPNYVKINDYEVRSTQNHIMTFIFGGIILFLFALPLFILDIDFFTLFSWGFYFLYLGLGMYIRKDVFNDENVYEEINEYYGEDLI